MTDDETWVDADHANTLNAFDVGDTRTTHAIVASGSAIQSGEKDEIIAFYPTGGSQNGFWDTSGVSPTIKVGSGVGASNGIAIADVASTLQARGKTGGHSVGAEMAAGGHLVPVAIPLQGGRALAKNQNGLGIGVEGDPAYTLDRTGAQSVAHAGGQVVPFDTNFSNQATPGGDISATLDTRGKQGVAQAFTQNQREEVRDLGDQSGALTGQGTRQQTYLREHMTVRRLTPVECERLMGWPDGWTAPDGVKASDSKRYAACGDGIVAPVAFWIADRIRMIEEEEAS